MQPPTGPQRRPALTPAHHQRPVRRQALNREGPTDACLGGILVWLIKEKFDIGVSRDRRLDLCVAHPLDDVRVVGDGTQHHMWNPPVHETPTDVIAVGPIGKVPWDEFLLLRPAFG